MRIIIYCLLAMLWPAMNSYAQSPVTGIRPLTIGDVLPNIEIPHLFNYPASKIHLSDLKGKLVILDFMATSCKSCIELLPKLDSLQKTYSGKIQIILVTGENKKRVQSFLSDNKFGKQIKLPFASGDSLLKLYFPFELISHEVWIGADGVVKAITEADYINQGNIQKLLDTVAVDWPVKRDIMDFNYSKPFIKLDNFNSAIPESLYYSAITGHLAGVNSTTSISVDSLKKIITINNYNVSLLQLCNGSLEGTIGGTIDLKRMVMHVKDSGRYVRRSDYSADWDEKNSFCYAIALPLGLSKEEIRRFIRGNLSFWLKYLFNIRIERKKTLVNCLALTSAEDSYRLLKSKGEFYTSFDEPGNPVKQLKNSTITNLIWYFNNTAPGIPWVLNETSIPADQRIDISLKVMSLSDLSGVKKQLQLFGLDLVPVKRELEMIFLKDNDSH